MNISQLLLGMIWKHAHLRRAGSHKIAKLSRLYIDAYENYDYDINSNGERRVIERVAAIHPAEVFDIGANAGDFGRIFLAKSGARVHFFELCEETFRRLNAAVAAGDRVKLNNLGVADQEKAVEYRYYPASDGLTTLITSKQVHNAAGELRHGCTTTVDTYASLHNVASIDYLKIDVEGAEHLVLKGSERMLKEKRIKAIQFEYGMASIYTRFLLKDFYALLEPLGYRIGKIMPSHVEWRSYDPRHEDFRGPNFLAVLSSEKILIDAVS